jgi:hypothetical protein
MLQKFLQDYNYPFSTIFATYWKPLMQVFGNRLQLHMLQFSLYSKIQEAKIRDLDKMCEPTWWRKQNTQSMFFLQHGIKEEVIPIPKGYVMVSLVQFLSLFTSLSKTNLWGMAPSKLLKDCDGN